MSMKNKISIIGFALFLAASLNTRGQQVTTPTPALAFPKPPPSNVFTNPSPDGFKPLTRLRTQADASRNNVYVVGQPKGQLLDGGVTPNYVVVNGRVTPYTNLNKIWSSGELYSQSGQRDGHNFQPARSHPRSLTPIR